MPIEPLIVTFGYRLKEQYRQGLVFHTKMNVNSGTVLPDLSGNNNHGTLTSMANPPSATSGWAGSQGLRFDGVNDYVEKTGFAFVAPPFTISAWVMNKGGYVSSYNSIVSRGGANANNCNFDFGMRKQATLLNSRVYLYWRNGSTTYGTEIVDSALQSTANWVYITGVVDSSYNLTLYVNGVSIGTDGSNAIPTDGSQALRIGAWSGTQITSDYFNGIIDDVRIYNRALSADEVMHSFAQQEDEWGLGLDDDLAIMQGIPIALLQSGNLMGVR